MKSLILLFFMFYSPLGFAQNVPVELTQEVNAIIKENKEPETTALIKRLYYSSSPYDILGVSPDSDPETIKKAYKRISSKVHPDKQNSLSARLKKFFSQIVNDAYERISSMIKYADSRTSSSKKAEEEVKDLSILELINYDPIYKSHSLFMGLFIKQDVESFVKRSLTKYNKFSHPHSIEHIVFMRNKVLQKLLENPRLKPLVLEAQKTDFYTALILLDAYSKALEEIDSFNPMQEEMHYLKLKALLYLFDYDSNFLRAYIFRVLSNQASFSASINADVLLYKKNEFFKLLEEFNQNQFGTPLFHMSNELANTILSNNKIFKNSIHSQAKLSSTVLSFKARCEYIFANIRKAKD